MDCHSLFWESQFVTVPLDGHCGGYNHKKDKIIFSPQHVKAIQNNGLWEHLLLTAVHELTHMADFHSPIREKAVSDSPKAEASRREAFLTDNLAGLLFNSDYYYDCSEINAKGSQLAYIHFYKGCNIEAAIEYEYNALRIPEEDGYGKELTDSTNSKLRDWLDYVRRKIEKSLERIPTLIQSTESRPDICRMVSIGVV